jgi:molecular chaperone GrpE
MGEHQLDGTGAAPNRESTVVAGPPSGAHPEPSGQARDDDRALRERLAHVEDQWRRAEADLDNLRKRMAREEQRHRQEERARVAAAWLPVVDNLERALEHAADSGSTPIVDGIRAVRDQAVEVLDRLGFPRRDETGAAFDPARHEAVSVVPAPGTPPGTVLRVLRPGYGDDGCRLRPAAVVVAAGER